MTVNGTSIHFIHHPSPRPDAIPLIMTHGWPGSFLEFLDLIKPLAESPAREQAFHVVVPSLPGYGFSEPAKRKNFAVLETARAYDELMRGLGYSKYIAQGGDLGSSVSKALAIAFPGSCKAMHVGLL
jgi:pimeloyl-ACP methyl ester carboxylesterase